jgi:hypothetical protein
MTVAVARDEDMFAGIRFALALTVFVLRTNSPAIARMENNFFISSNLNLD